MKEPTSTSLIQELANNPEILLPDRPIAFNRAFVRLGIGVTGALFLSQALYWSKRTKDPEGWFYKTIEDWQEETGLTREEQLTIKKKLTNLGFLDVKKKGVPATNHFKIDQYSLALCMVKLDFYDDQSQGIPSTESTENQPPVAGNPDDLPITESTTESTTKRGKPRTPREWTNLRREERGLQPIRSKRSEKQVKALDELLRVDQVIQRHREMSEGEGEDYSFMDSGDNARIRQQIARFIPKVENMGKTVEDFIEYLRQNEWARSIGYNPLKVYTDSMLVDFAIGKVSKKKEGKEVREI